MVFQALFVTEPSSEKHFRTIPDLAGQIAVGMIRMADTDKNGKLSIDEFKSFSSPRRHPGEVEREQEIQKMGSSQDHDQESLGREHERKDESFGYVVFDNCVLFVVFSERTSLKNKKKHRYTHTR